MSVRPSACLISEITANCPLVLMVRPRWRRPPGMEGSCADNRQVVVL
jgi:hypothetical protein